MSLCRPTPLRRGVGFVPLPLSAASVHELRCVFPSVDIRDATIKEKARAAMWMSAACMPAAWYIAGMKKKPLTVTEFARMGGKARAQKLSARATTGNCFASRQERRPTAQGHT